MTAVLAIDGLGVEFRRGRRTSHPLRGVNLRIRAGERVGLVGESGSGKSLTALSALRLLPRRATVVSGSIELAGESILDIPERAMRSYRGRVVAMVPQDPLGGLNPVQTIGFQIIEALRAHGGMDKSEAFERAVELLSSVGMSDPDSRMRAYPHEFSGGMRQRVLIAMALALEPRLLIADEPTTALDVTVQAQVLDLIDDLTRATGTAVLLVTHDLAVAADRTDRICVMYGGRIVEEAPTAQIFAHPMHPYTRTLLASSPRFDRPRRQRLAVPAADNSPAIGGCAYAPRCPLSDERCRTVEPPLSGDTHTAACWHPHQGAPE